VNLGVVDGVVGIAGKHGALAGGGGGAAGADGPGDAEAPEAEAEAVGRGVSADGEDGLGHELGEHVLAGGFAEGFAETVEAVVRVGEVAAEGGNLGGVFLGRGGVEE